MSDFEKLTDEELEVLYQVDPSAAPINPWHPKFDNTPKGKDIRMRYEAANPTLAAGLKSKAPGFQLSARAEMYNRGLIGLDKSIHDELMSVDPVYRKQKEADKEVEDQRLDRWLKDETLKTAQRNGNKATTYEEYEKEEMPFFGAGPMAQARRNLWVQQQQEKAMGGWN